MAKIIIVILSHLKLLIRVGELFLRLLCSRFTLIKLQILVFVCKVNPLPSQNALFSVSPAESARAADVQRHVCFLGSRVIMDVNGVIQSEVIQWIRLIHL